MASLQLGLGGLRAQVVRLLQLEPLRLKLLQTRKQRTRILITLWVQHDNVKHTVALWLLCHGAAVQRAVTGRKLNSLAHDLQQQLYA